VQREDWIYGKLLRACHQVSPIVGGRLLNFERATNEIVPQLAGMSAATNWPNAHHDVRQNVDLGDGADGPRVHTFARVVSLDPPTLGLTPHQPFDRQRSLAGQTEHCDLANTVDSPAHKKDIAGPKRWFHGATPNPDQTPRAEESGGLRVSGAAGALGTHRE